MDQRETERVAEMFVRHCFDMALRHFDLVTTGHYRLAPFVEMHSRLTKLDAEQQLLCRECVRSAIVCALDALFSEIHERGLPAVQPGTDLSEVVFGIGGSIEKVSRYKSQLRSAYDHKSSG